jgi:putative oxidoreductase
VKYAVWFLRLLFASWMIPAGVNHFYSIFPQPMGSQPLSKELIVALIDSHLFDIVKVVELVAGIGVLTGFHSALAVLICVPVSFCVFYWDAPLEGWGSRAAKFGYAVLLANLLLCVAYVRSYSPMFTAGSRKPLLLAGRLLFGAWMLANGINHFFLPLWPQPVGHEPLAMQLMAAFTHSGLFDVAMAIELIVGALLLAGVLVPLALCLVMPVSTCALYFSVVLEHRPLGAALALAAFALNGLLMLGHLDCYKGVLQRWVPTLGEGSGAGAVFESVFVRIGGRTSRAEFVPALLTLLALVCFYLFVVKGRTAQWCLLVLLVPAAVLMARRLRDMGRSAWWVLVPAALLCGAFTVWLGMLGREEILAPVLHFSALAVAAGCALLGSAAPTRSA